MYKVQFMVICISLLWKLLLHTATTEIKYSSTKKQSKQSEATEKLRFNGSFARNGNKKYDFLKTS